MKKRLLKLAGLSALILSSTALADATTDFGIATPQLNAQAYILMDYNSGAVLASLNPDQRQYPASLTKMMTAYVVGEAIKQGKVHNSDVYTVNENSWAQKFPGSSLMFLDLNKQVTVGELMRGLIIVSGNDAAVALAEHTSGSQASFIDEMNKHAQRFGLQNTHFTTVHGLDDPNQYSSARDMAIIGTHVIRDQPEEYKIYSEKDLNLLKMRLDGHSNKEISNLLNLQYTNILSGIRKLVRELPKIIEVDQFVELYTNYYITKDQFLTYCVNDGRVYEILSLKYKKGLTKFPTREFKKESNEEFENWITCINVWKRNDAWFCKRSG